MITLSIIIVNYKSWEHLSICLDSIQNQKKINPEIIVLDNNSNDSKIDNYKSKYNYVKWIENPKNYGFSRACNIGASNATGKWLLFLNPDTKIPNDCLDILLNRVKNINNTIFSIKQLDNKNKNTNAYGIFLNLYSINGILRFIYRLIFGISKNKISQKTSFSPDWISGSFLLLRQSDYIKIGGWDEDYWMYYEDMDICKRARSFKIHTLFFNDLYCYHYHGKSSRNDFQTKINSKAEVIKSSLIYINKHFDGLYARLLCFIIFSSKIIELITLSFFLKEKRSLLKKILKF